MKQFCYQSIISSQKIFTVMSAIIFSSYLFNNKRWESEISTIKKAIS